ncbi:serine hydrolase domain-containing protein [Shivajiella indica]|uniref:Serine hydrolase domain-containing protein n=1 Tax=Shivajiella indica TaxID=872115 RepID=A0ABW5B428_9BACT
MKFQSIIIFAISCITLVSCKNEDTKSTQTSIPGSIDQYMTALTKLKQFNGVLLIEDSLGNAFSKAYNIEDGNVPSLPVTVEHQFDLRSIAKLLAKASLIKLEHEGKIHFDQKLSEFFPDFPRGDEITIDQLMHHKSGLGRELSNYEGPNAQLSPNEIIELIHQEKLEFEPGQDSRYSNLGFQLLYKIVGDLSGGTYADYLRNNFFDPLGMDNSGSHYLDPKARLDNYAYGHFLYDMDSVQKVGKDDSDMQQGHTFSTVNDMKKFLDFIGSNKIYEELIEDDAISHAGGSKGKRAWVYSDQKKNYKIIFLANYDNIPFSNLTKDLRDMMEGKEVEIPVEVKRQAVEVAASILKNYTGTYDFVDAGHILISIKFEDGGLNAYQKGELAGALIPENDSTFFWDAKSKESFIFTTDEEGNQKALMDFQGVRWDGVLIK